LPQVSIRRITGGEVHERHLTNRAGEGFTPGRFAQLVFAVFLQVMPGLETFVVRDFGLPASPAPDEDGDYF
jgi:hypothetical protein